jgi:hypothetical protein
VRRVLVMQMDRQVGKQGAERGWARCLRAVSGGAVHAAPDQGSRQLVSRSPGLALLLVLVILPPSRGLQQQRDDKSNCCSAASMQWSSSAA